MEPEREIVKSGGLKSPGVFMKNTTLIWDSQNINKNGKNGKNLKIEPKLSRRKKIQNYCSGVLLRIKTIMSILFDRNNYEIDENNLENGTEKEYDSDDENNENNDENENEKEDYFPLILGNTEESHLMSVFRAQVNVSESRISVLEDELKKLRQTQGREVGLRVDTGGKNRRNLKSSGSSTSSLERTPSQISTNGHSMNGSALMHSDSETKNENGDNGNENGNRIINGNSNGNHIISVVTDASDDKWNVHSVNTTHNPLLKNNGESKDSKEVVDEVVAGRSQGAADRLLTLSRISLQAREGIFLNLNFTHFPTATS